MRSRTELTDAQRAVYELHAQGLPDRVIAQRLGMSDSAVRDRMYRVRAKLRIPHPPERPLREYRAPPVPPEPVKRASVSLSLVEAVRVADDVFADLASRRLAVWLTTPKWMVDRERERQRAAREQ